MKNFRAGFCSWSVAVATLVASLCLTGCSSPAPPPIAPKLSQADLDAQIAKIQNDPNIPDKAKQDMIAEARNRAK